MSPNSPAPVYSPTSLSVGGRSLFLGPLFGPLAGLTFLGTAVIAQLGIWLIVAYTWAAALSAPLSIFTYHPLLQTVSCAAFVQAILVLQPTHAPDQKRAGQRVHASLVLVGIVLATAGTAVIEYNKISGGREHFRAVHNYLGVTTGVVIVVQVLFGFTMWAVPALYGGEARAKAVWKYHRWSGYTILVLLLATIISATKTDANDVMLGMSVWMLSAFAVLVLLGTFPRIKLQKMGLAPRRDGQ